MKKGKHIKTSMETFLEEKELNEIKSMTREERWDMIHKIVEENAAKRTKTLDELADEANEWINNKYKDK